MNIVHLNPALSEVDPQWQNLVQLYLQGNLLSSYKNRFLVKKGHQLISLPVSEIRYFYSKDKLSFAKTLSGKDFVLDFTMGELEKLVSPDLFFRVNRQYIISHAAISKVVVWFHGKLKLEVQPDNTSEIIISRERVNGFKTWLGE